MSDDLVEEVARAICFSRNAPTCSCTKETGCLASVMVRVEATQARAAIAAVADWLNEHHKQLWLGSENHASPALREQLEAKGTHGTPELDEDARKLAAMGQDPGATFATEPEVVCDTLVCIWGSNLTQRRSGLHDVSWVRCDGSHVQYYAENTPCFVCGRRVKIAGGG